MTDEEQVWRLAAELDASGGLSQRTLLDALVETTGRGKSMRDLSRILREYREAVTIYGSRAVDVLMARREEAALIEEIAALSAQIGELGKRVAERNQRLQDLRVNIAQNAA